MKKMKILIEAVVVIAVVMALILPTSAVVTNNKIMNNKNELNKSYSTTLSAINKLQPNPEPANRGMDVLVSWDNPDDDDEKPKIAANSQGVIVITYEAVLELLKTVNPITYSDDSGDSWNLAYVLDSEEYDGSGTVESPDIIYCPAREEFIFGSIDPLVEEDVSCVYCMWIPGDIASGQDAALWGYSWVDSENYDAAAITYVGEWAVLLNIDDTISHGINDCPALAYWLWVEEDLWAYHPNEIDPTWAHGGYFDGQSILETAPASEPEIATGQNRMFMVMETYNETLGYSMISYKATYTDLDPFSDTFLFTLGGGPGGMDKYADIEVWPFQMYIAENANDPDVSASGSTVAVVYSQGGDVKCKVSDNDGDTFSEKTVETGAGYPCVYIAGSRIYVAYVKNENLYITNSDDLGETWATPTQINDEDGSVVEETGTAELGEYGIVWTDKRDEQYDIFFEYIELAVDPPGRPTITGPTKGKPGESLTFKFKATDPNGDDVKFIITWGDGKTKTTTFVASGTEKTETHSWDEQDEFTITAYAEDTTGAAGPTATHKINIPRNRARFHNLFDIFPNFFRILNIIFG